MKSLGILSLKVSVFQVVLTTVLLLSLSTTAFCECDLWGQIGSPEFYGNGYNHVIDEFRRASQGDSYPRTTDYSCIHGWGVLAFVINQPGPIDYNTTDFVWDSYDDGGIHNDYDDANFNIDHTAPVGDQVYLAIGHARRGTGGPDAIADPHPFIYTFNGQTHGFAHNGSLGKDFEVATFWAKMKELIGDEYWGMDLFDRDYCGSADPVDSELFGMLLMKNVLIADNYGFNHAWAVNRTQYLMEYYSNTTWSAYNMIYTDGTDVIAARNHNFSNDNQYKYRLWHTENTDDTDNCYVISSDVTPNTSLADGIDDWDELGNNQYVILNQPSGDIEGPYNLTMAYFMPISPEIVVNQDQTNDQENPDIADGPYGDYIIVWDNDDDEIRYRYVNQMGLCQHEERIIAQSEIYDYANPEVAFDPSTNDFYVVYQRRPYNVTPYDAIMLHKFTYSSATNDWTAENPVVVNSQPITSYVENPVIDIANDGSILVVYSEKWDMAGFDDWEINSRAYSNNGNVLMDYSYIGESVIATGIDKRYPAVAYIGTRDNEPLFAVAYNRNLGADDNGVYLSRVWPTRGAGRKRANIIDEITSSVSYSRPRVTTTYGISGIEIGGGLVQLVIDHQIIVAYRKTDTVNDNYELVTKRYIRPWAIIMANAPWNSNETNTLTYDRDDYYLNYELDVDGRPDACYDVAFILRDDEGDNIRQTMTAGFGAYNSALPVPELWSFGTDSRINKTPRIAVAPDYLGGDDDKHLVVYSVNNRDDDDYGIVSHFYKSHYVETPGTGKAIGKGEEPEITSVELPSEYALYKAYPNPFNPSTTIGFEIPTASNVKIMVYNVQGQLVSTLVNGYLSSGHHQVVFNAENLPSGMYFYRMQAGGFTSTEKMILMK